MKLGITILAALALIALDRVSAAGAPSQRLMIKVADQAGLQEPLWSNRPRYRLAHHRYRSYGSYPVACEAVIFPRSPLCTGRPAAFGPYGTFPRNLYWYY